jgi:TonB family protein
MYKSVLLATVSAVCAWSQQLTLSPGQCGDPAVAGRIQPGMRPPEIRHKFDPPYPDEAVRDGITGTVKICFAIDTNGTPSHFSVTQPLGPILDATALNTVKQWQYIPAIDEGSRPVKVWVEIPINFTAPQTRRYATDATIRQSTLRATPQPVPPNIPESTADTGSAPAPPEAKPHLAPLAPLPDGKVRVIVGESEMFYSTGFAGSNFSGSAAGSIARASGGGFAVSSSGILKFTIDVMKALNENCPQVIVVNDPDQADYFLRLDRNGVLILTAEMVSFNRSGVMTFVTATHSIKKDVKRFCDSLPATSGLSYPVPFEHHKGR